VNKHNVADEAVLLSRFVRRGQPVARRAEVDTGTRAGRRFARAEVVGILGLSELYWQANLNDRAAMVRAYS